MLNNKLMLNNINDNQSLALDPDNVFWAIFKKNNNSLPENVLSLYKKVKNKLDMVMSEFRFSSNLTAVYIDPTDRCNANCPYCYVPAKIRKNGTDMNYEQLEYILKKIDKYFKAQNSHKKPVIVFHASEPLLVKDIIFKAIINFEDEFNFGVQTNALLLEKDDVEFFKTHRVGVGISLDSFVSKINNKQRPSKIDNGNFNMAVRAIELFNGYEGLNVIATITRFNVVHLPELVKFLHLKKVPCVLLNPIRLTSKTSRSLKPDEKLLTKYFIKAVKNSIELSKSNKHKIIIGNFSNIILGIVAPVARRLMCDISPCGGGRCFLTITAKGEMIPCGEFIGLNGFSGGNIFNTTISKAMKSKPFKKIRSRIVEKISKCNTCEFRNICGAPCPAELHSFGNMYQVSIFCEFYKEIIKYAFKLIADNKLKYILRPEYFKSLEYEYNIGKKI